MQNTVTTNDEYSFMLPHVLKVRDAVRGSVFVKAKRNLYLPHTSAVDPNQLERYNKFLAGAEFDDFTGHTKRVMLGKAKLDDIKFTPPTGLEYLEEDVDKDGLSMGGLVESCYADVMEVKWRVLLTDYKGMSDLEIGETDYSAQDIKDANPRPTIKQYPRESVIDLDFARINGVMQLTYLVLLENGCEVNHETGARTNVVSYLKLGLDDDGYYQQKKTDSTSGESSYGKKNYLLVDKKPLQFIPVSFACDEEILNGKLPIELGFLAPISDLAYARYQVSAKYKEALDAFIPTLIATGVDERVMEDFEKVNKRSDFVTGMTTCNFLSGTKDNPVDVKLLEASGSLTQFTTYFEDNKNRVGAIGGVFKTDKSVQRTATEVIEEASSNAAVLMPIANNVESAVKWQIAYCAMFEGNVAPENLGDYVRDIDLHLPRDFEASKLTVEEIKAFLEVYATGLLPREEFLKIMELGGRTISSAEDLLDRLDAGEI